MRLPATLDCWLSVKEVDWLPNARQKKQLESDQSASWWSELVAAVVTSLRTPSLTHVVEPRAIGRQAGSRNKCDGLGATIESGGVCGELACASPLSQLWPHWALCFQICSYFQKKQDIGRVVFLRKKLHVIRCTNPI